MPRRPPQPYLLVRLAVCARCGARMIARSRSGHADGTFLRGYVCVNNRKACHDDRCTLARIDAVTIEAMFVSALPTLLGEGSQQDRDDLAEGELEEEGASALAAERKRLIDVIATGGDLQIDAALQRLFTRMSPDAASVRDAAISRYRARQHGATRRFQVWAEQEKQGRTTESASETLELNRLLRTWFTSVAVDTDDASVEITSQRRAAAGEFPPATITVHLDRGEHARLNDRPHGKHQRWADAEIVGALQAWSDTHGRSPQWHEWKKADDHRPATCTVTKRYGTWDRALERAGLTPNPRLGPACKWAWNDEEIITALTAWAAEHGQLPDRNDWLCGTPEHPCASTVQAHFGSWRAGLEAAATSRALRARPYA
jgi:hypothetical protein